MIHFSNNYLCALDFGSSKIAAAVARVKKGRVQRIYLESLPTKGMRAGVIVDAIELVTTLTRLMKALKEKSGIAVKAVSVNVSGGDISARRSRAIIPLAERGNKVITLSDIHKVNDQARILGSSLDEEILHTFALGYTIDAKARVFNPLGLYSHRLEVDLLLLCGKLSSIQTLGRVVHQAGFELQDIFVSGIATRHITVEAPRRLPQALSQAHEGYVDIHVLCDVGADITEIVIFEGERIREIEIIPMGGNDSTRHLAETLKIPFELAEEIKRSHGSIVESAHISDDKEILIKKSTLYKPIKQKEVTALVTAHTKQMCIRLKDVLFRRASPVDIRSFTVVGRTALLEGFIETMESVMGISVRLGRINRPDIFTVLQEEHALAGQKYLTYLTSLGMLSASLEKNHGEAGLTMTPLSKNPFLRMIGRMREVYQEYF